MGSGTKEGDVVEKEIASRRAPNLKDLRQLRQARAAHWDRQKHELEEGRKDSLREALSLSSKKVADVNKDREWRKQEVKAELDAKLTTKVAERDRSIANIMAEFEAFSKELNKTKDERYSVINENAQKALQPFHEQYKAEIAGVEADFKEEMEFISARRKEELAKIDVHIDELEAKAVANIIAESPKPSDIPAAQP